jgi:hypothetical protein
MGKNTRFERPRRRNAARQSALPLGGEHYRSNIAIYIEYKTSNNTTISQKKETMIKSKKLFTFLGVLALLLALTTTQVLAAATLTLSKSYGLPGVVITVSGSGYAATETVTIKLGTVILGTATTSAGAFSKSVTIPSTMAPGTYLMTATGATSGVIDQATFKVLAPNLTVNPSSGLAGTVTTVSGTQFHAGETITIMHSTTILGTTTATLTGTFSKSVTIPSTAATGTFSLKAVGGTSGILALGSFKVLANPLTLSKTYGLPGAVIGVSGSGYAATETVVIKLGTVILGSVTTSAGAFSTTVTIPLTMAPGTYLMTATGQTSGHVDQATFKVLAPTLVLNPSSGLPGTVTTVSGSKFAAGETITIKLGTTILGTTTATSTGTFSKSVTIPSTLAIGTYTITATGGTSKILALGKFTVN